MANVQHIYGLPPAKKIRRLDRMSPPKTNKRVLSLDVEGESKPIMTKINKPSNIFQGHAEKPLNDIL